ncbi:hypothetical protein [Shewanella aestuarii]|uniref:Uncharacterized protein n=1 Tax=Shewanella aestuarii TaxID=1028752 RepID=A0A6G9QS60_9GAMM|nr:hypothetical protein [Shewanella aestuarii]QIR16619.1 hypothetical protein HBH39_19275 [Shewanella aestuarii]
MKHSNQLCSMTFTEIQSYLKARSPHLQIVQTKCKHNQSKISWWIGFAGIKFEDFNYVVGFDFTHVKHEDNQVSKNEVLRLISQCTPTLNKLIQLTAFHENCLQLELEDEKNATNDYDKLMRSRFAHNAKRTLEALQNIKHILYPQHTIADLS